MKVNTIFVLNTNPTLTLDTHLVCKQIQTSTLDTHLIFKQIQIQVPAKDYLVLHIYIIQPFFINRFPSIFDH